MKPAPTTARDAAGFALCGEEGGSAKPRSVVEGNECLQSLMKLEFG